jgi:predicted ABC-type exoprotein transport system permease subunit
MKISFFSLTRSLWILFLLVIVLVFPVMDKLAGWKVNGYVVIGANALLFATSLLNLFLQWKNLQRGQGGAIIRGVMAGTFLKLFVLAGGAIIYLLAAGANRSVNAVFGGMGLYIVYTWLEVRISLRLNPGK